jgi:hypothetical protein
VLHRLNTISNITLQFNDLFDNALSPHPSIPIWNGSVRDLGLFVETWQAINVPSHGVRMITVLLVNITLY